jgi:hypothetical protein
MCESYLRKPYTLMACFLSSAIFYFYFKFRLILLVLKVETNSITTRFAGTVISNEEQVKDIIQ